MVAETKGTRMNTKALAVAASLWVPMVASAATEATVTERQEALSAQLEQILSKAGISLGGAFRGEVGSSTIDGNYVKPLRRNDEQIGFTSVDFDLRARPNTATTARAVFRMHLDHANFFGSPYSPLETRWLSLDGGFFDMAYYHFGNLQTKWSPLVIGTNEPGFLYTPRIFAQQQKQAMDERFIGGGVRNLQGANLGLRAAVPAISIDSFDVSLLAAKLLTAGGMGDPRSVNTSKANLGGDALSGAPDSLANFDRWALGAKANVAFLKGLSLGGSILSVKDLKSTFGTTDTANRVVRTQMIRIDSVVGGAVVKTTASDSFAVARTGTYMSPAVGRDTTWQNGLVLGGSLGADVASMLGNSNLIAGLSIDAATSSWDRYSTPGLKNATVARLDSALKNGSYYVFVRDTGYFFANYKKVSGLALNIGLNAGWKNDAMTIKARGGFLMNDSAFRSDLAQSPVFYPALGRVFNTEQDSVGGLRHYNTFDALYHQVHRYVPEDANEYAKSPYDKSAYSNYAAGSVNPSMSSWTVSVANAFKAKKVIEDTIAAVIARGGVATGDSAKLANSMKNLPVAVRTLYVTALDGFAWDRDLQLVLPVGEASANRVGPKFGLDFDLMQGGVEVKVDGYMLQEAKGTILDSVKQLVAEKAKFQQIQAGARVRADRFISGWDKPIELSGSVGLSTAKGGTALNYQSTVINAGLYAGVIKRLAVLGGYQLIDGKDKAFLVDRKQSNMAAGLEFKVQEGAYLLGMYNLVKTEFPNATQYNFDQTIWSTKISVSF